MTLWTSAEIADATGGTASGAFDVTGVAYDSREVGPGDLFVALTGAQSDGHRFVEQAFAQGAAGVLVSQAVAGPHVLVADTAAALDALARASRARTAATIVGVTGSVGKTGVKEALAAAFARAHPGRVHRSLKSYNNHVGVPLSLARMPRDTRFAVFEMGMNHAGELARLTRLVRPHVAVVTTVALAHGAFFAGEEAIADAKGEIFQGLEPGGIAIVPHDNAHRDRLATAAAAARIVTFGCKAGADVHAREGLPTPSGTLVAAALPGDVTLTYTVAYPGEHWVVNSLAVLAAVQAAGGDLAAAGLALADMEGLPGRGRRLTLANGALLIDEAYNANPASMRATLKVLAAEKGRRKLAILGDMRELGDDAPAHHEALADAVAQAGVEFALLVGSEMAALAAALEGRVAFAHAPDVGTAIPLAREAIAPGDAVLVKGSNGIGLARLVDALAGD